PRRPSVRVREAAAGDLLGTDAHDLVTHAVGPRTQRQARDRVERVTVAHLLRVPDDEDAPTLVAERLRLVDLERDLPPQNGRRKLRTRIGAKHDVVTEHREVDRQDRRVVTEL